MNLTITRDVLSDVSTMGLLDIMGLFQCYSIELPLTYQGQQNVPDKTCIPNGTYQVEIRWSPKHGFEVPWILNVPDRADIEIHPANDAPELLGCVAVGQTRSPNWVGASQLAFGALMAKLKTAENGITITLQQNNPFQVTDPELGQ
jgi:hypothetical protein